ncbi:MAG: hypothetical protein GX131_06345 [candidate division WS1 bacterium]|jgi:hypothetical protein|nr:hypothetical protein [candidate division WS1 bacterium]
MSDEIMMRVHKTTDLTEAAALWALGHPLHDIEVRDGWATFAIGYTVEQHEIEASVEQYRRGELLVEAGEFARRRNETAAKMRRAIAVAAEAADE